MTKASQGRGELTPMEGRILRAAVKLFAEKGFDATTVQEVVSAAEVTKGALYHYFDSKDDLLYEIYHSLIGLQTADLDGIIARDLGAKETVRAILMNLVVTTAGRIDETAVFVREMHKLNSERMAAFRADRRRYQNTFRDVIAKAQAAGEFNAAVPADTAVLIALGVVNQLPNWYRPDGPKSPEQLGAEIADFVLAGLQV